MDRGAPLAVSDARPGASLLHRSSSTADTARWDESRERYLETLDSAQSRLFTRVYLDKSIEPTCATGIKSMLGGIWDGEFAPSLVNVLL